MTGDYYDPQPRLVIEEPVLLVGLPGSGVAQVARSLCATTGLAFNDVERNAESMLGRSRSQILLESGLEALRSVERRALRGALGRSPCGIVASEGVWPEQGDQVRALLPLASVVYVRRPASALLERLLRELESSPGRQPDFLIGAPQTPERLSAYLSDREAVLATAPIVVEAEDDHPHQVARHLRASLERIVGTSPL